MEQDREIYEADRPFQERVQELLSKMTLEEKVLSDDIPVAGHRPAGNPRVQLVERSAARRGAVRRGDHVRPGHRTGGNLR